MNRDKVIKALQRDIRITERDPEMLPEARRFMEDMAMECTEGKNNVVR